MSAVVQKAIYPSRTPEKQHEYYERFYAKRCEEGQQTCPVCFGSYTYFNKSHHNKTAHHIKAVNYKEKMKQKEEEQHNQKIAYHLQ